MVVVRSSVSVFSEKKMPDEYLVLLIARAVLSSYFSLATAAVPGRRNILYIIIASFHPLFVPGLCSTLPVS